MKEGPGRISSGPSRATWGGEATGKDRGKTSKPRQHALECIDSGGIVACREADCFLQREGGIMLESVSKFGTIHFRRLELYFCVEFP